MLKNITLEISLKPFRETSDEYIKKICREVFMGWKPLLKSTEGVSVLFWTADGSELLDYKGDPDESFEWAYLIGGANLHEEYHPMTDPDKVGLHSRNYRYIENPPVMTYGILKKIVATVKETGREILGLDVTVGTTFDPGPEFAKSPFKYERHPEICKGSAMGQKSMVCSYATLHGDNAHYAAFPDGISEGLPFGTFFGRQANIFLRDMGFDYIWLSNGLGFGVEPWSATGAVFDGKEFKGEALAGIKQLVMDFWRLFRQECPDYPIQVRGTNMSMGIDFATDGVPLKEIYEGVSQLLPPPNSPWAALNGNFGLELMGHMSRIAEVPADEYLFRYYIHDPWWVNSPWYDRYNSLPHDIYLPLAVSRIDRDGNVKSPTQMNLLSIDNSFGEMPDACINEPTPHLIRAIKDTPDEVPPVVWVYPYAEYSAVQDEAGLKDMYFADHFICDAINRGLPVSSVVSTDNFARHDMEIYRGSVIVSPPPAAGSAYEDAILRYLNQGGKAIFYGGTAMASKRFTDYIGVKKGNAASGLLDLCRGSARIGKVMHDPLLSGGEITEEACSGKATMTAGGKAYAVYGENYVWVRGSAATKDSYPVAGLLTDALTHLGYEIIYETPDGEKRPVMTIHRSNNAFIFSTFLPSTTVRTKLRFPAGAPVLDAYETRLDDGYATYCFPKAERRECRVFVEQKSGIVGVREVAPVSAEYRRRIQVFGLKNATVRFLAETYCTKEVFAALNSATDFYTVGDPFESGYVTIGNDVYYEAKNVTGNLVLSMPMKQDRKIGR